MKQYQLMIVTLAGAATIFMTGCVQTGAEQGALIGAGSGALIGQAVGHDTKSTMIGAAVGGIAGAAIGDHQDKQHTNRRYYRDQYGHTYYIGSDGRAYYVD